MIALFGAPSHILRMALHCAVHSLAQARCSSCSISGIWMAKSREATSASRARIEPRLASSSARVGMDTEPAGAGEEKIGVEGREAASICAAGGGTGEASGILGALNMGLMAASFATRAAQAGWANVALA